jgi:hypothetical protein
VHATDRLGSPPVGSSWETALVSRDHPMRLSIVEFQRQAALLASPVP